MNDESGPCVPQSRTGWSNLIAHLKEVMGLRGEAPPPHPGDGRGCLLLKHPYLCPSSSAQEMALARLCPPFCPVRYVGSGAWGLCH